MMESPFVLPANRHWQQPFEGTACAGQNKTVKRTKARILILTPGPTFRKTFIQNYTCTSTFTVVVPPTAKTQTQEKVRRQIKS